MKNKGKRISELLQALLKRTGGIVAIFIAGLLLNIICILSSASTAQAELESQCNIVQPGKCAACHPRKNPGKCNLVDFHSKKKADCVTCHGTCVNEGSPSFDHMEICLGCHDEKDKIHDKHRDKEKFNCNNCHGKKILIAVDSKHGSTAAYADKLGEQLCLKGFQVDVGRVNKILDMDISKYDGFVIGSPTYWGFPLRDLRTFLKLNKAKMLKKPTAYLYNSVEGAETGNSKAKAFLQFAYNPVLKNDYSDLFPIQTYLQNQTPPNGNCDLTFNPASGMPKYDNCEVPAWVGLMTGQWIPRIGFPVEYMPMELFGFGGYKPYYRENAAVEFAQTLSDIKFFDGACGPNNIAPLVAISATPTSGTQPLQVTFSAAASDSDGKIVSYLWTFGDGATSTQINPVHVY
ncbi:MAG: PKD domain-containing protein, partial [Pseudomonadota bacterium]